MAIRPLDLQVSVPQANTVLKSNSNLANRADTAAHQFSEMLNKKTEDKQTQVIKTEETTQNAVDKDGRGGSSHNGSNKKNKNKKDNQPEKPKSNLYGSKFDFTI
jgi:hypothetical protein